MSCPHHWEYCDILPSSLSILCCSVLIIENIVMICPHLYIICPALWINWSHNGDPEAFWKEHVKLISVKHRYIEAMEKVYMMRKRKKQILWTKLIILFCAFAWIEFFCFIGCLLLSCFLSHWSRTCHWSRTSIDWDDIIDRTDIVDRGPLIDRNICFSGMLLTDLSVYRGYHWSRYLFLGDIIDWDLCF